MDKKLTNLSLIIKYYYKRNRGGIFMVNNKSLIASMMLISLLSMNSVMAGTNYSYQQVQPQIQVQPQASYNTNNYNFSQPVNYSGSPLQGSVVTVPAGAAMDAVLLNQLSSDGSSVGQMISTTLNQDFYYNGKLIAPAGSTVSGTVVQADRAKRGNINGKLCVRFTQLTTPMGAQIPISGVIKTDDGSGVLVGGTKIDATKEYAKDLAAGSAVGALSGLVFGALASGDKLGRGVALGTAVGAGGGLAKSVWNKGNDVSVPANAGIQILLTQPITATIANYSYEN